MSVSFGGVGEVFATFKTHGTVAAGEPVGMQANGQVKTCAAGAEFIGVAGSVAADGHANVQVKGYCEAVYSSTAPALGRTVLVADGAGGVKTAQAGTAYAVIYVDTTNKIVGFIM